MSKIREMQSKLKEIENQESKLSISMTTPNLIPGAKTAEHIPGIKNIYKNTGLKFSLNSDKEITSTMNIGPYSLDTNKDNMKTHSFTTINPVVPFISETISYNEEEVTLSSIFRIGPLSVELKKPYGMDDYYAKTSIMSGNPLGYMYSKAFESLLDKK